MNEIIVAVIAAVIPIVVGLILSRKKTVGYGVFINRFLGGLLLQKKATRIPRSIFDSIILTLRTTFQDLAFGIYIDARKDLTKEEKKKKIEEYLEL